jgi:hypothetical protein
MGADAPPNGAAAAALPAYDAAGEESTMPSVVLYSDEYDRAINDGTLAPETFDYRFLCEGDSWMDRSSPQQLSLPWALARIFKGSRGNRALFINLSRFGDTMRRIGDCLNDEFHMWVTTDLGWRFDALLLSAGGNDFIDAAQDPPPGQGILRDGHGAGPGLSAQQCFDMGALQDLVAHYLDPNFQKLYDTVRGDARHGAIPIFVNEYNRPVARRAPAVNHSWLCEAYDKNGVPQALWPQVTRLLFDQLQAAVDGWTQQGHDDVIAVPTSSVPLVPADAASTGSSGDWLNEIHPNKSGWGKLARAWLAAIDQRL